MTLDAHHSTAELKPTNEYGTSTSIGGAIFGVQSQTINFENDLPIISVHADAACGPGGDHADQRVPQRVLQGRDQPGPVEGPLRPRRRLPRQPRLRFQLRGQQGPLGLRLHPERDLGTVLHRAAPPSGPRRCPTTSSAASACPEFKGVSGSGSPNLPQAIYTFDFERMAELLRSTYNICSNPQTGTAAPGTCLANGTVDRRIGEKTISPFVQFNLKFDVGDMPTHSIGGVRYDQTTVTSTALVPTPVGTQWTGANEFALIYGPDNQFTTFKGSYQNWLPAVDFDIEPIRNVKLRASYSHTITRADYGSLQGGLNSRPIRASAVWYARQPRPGALQVEEHRRLGGMVFLP
ncbi:TonB-dependent receptor domain-containing protein [Sphingomonas sp. MMS24-JH45]